MEQSGWWALGIRRWKWWWWWRRGRGPWGQGPQQSGGGSNTPDLDELIRRSQDKLKRVLPGGSLGGPGVHPGRGHCVLGRVGIFSVQPDELGVVMRFGKYVRDAKPGANYHLPYPIESVLKPKVTRVNRIDIGMRMVEDLRRGSTVRDVPEESLMLTGDENIVDVYFKQDEPIPCNHKHNSSTGFTQQCSGLAGAANPEWYIGCRARKLYVPSIFVGSSWQQPTQNRLATLHRGLTYRELARG